MVAGRPLNWFLRTLLRRFTKEPVHRACLDVDSYRHQSWDPFHKEFLKSFSIALIKVTEFRLIQTSHKFALMSTSQLIESLLSGVPDYFYRNKISSGGDLSHYSSASLY